jgi:protein-tyrosine phosphatase
MRSGSREAQSAPSMRSGSREAQSAPSMRSGSREAQLAPPLVVLSVCLGNIWRSPMAERMLAHLVWERLGAAADTYVHSESAGTGGWHVNEPMNPPAARELRRRGAGDDGFQARKLLGAHLDTADLILTATAEQLEVVGGLRPDASHRAFVLGEFGRLLADIDPARLPVGASTPAGVYERGIALVNAVNVERAAADPKPTDDLDDPWGRGDVWFQRTADEIETALLPFVALLLPTHSPPATPV